MASSNPNPVSIDDSSHLEELKSMYLNIDWENEEVRFLLIPRLANLIDEWTGTLPNLRDIFQPQEIEQILLDYMNIMISVDKFYHEKLYQFIEFVVRTGYKDEPIVGIDDKPLLRRTTPIHRAITKCSETVVQGLFEIYNRFDVNYVDEFGCTHLHVACRYGLDEFVTKFLELGQVDLNCIEETTGDSPLHVALKCNQNAVIELLLRSGADPFLANKDGSTPLHIICDNICTHPNLARTFFKIIDEKLMNVKNEKTTPLKLALRQEHTMIESLMMKNVIIKRNGLTYQQVINKIHRDNDLAKMIFESSVDDNLQVPINAQDNEGNTPLHLALRNRSNSAAEWLLKNGANANVTNKKGETALHIICKKHCFYHSEDVHLAKMIFEHSHTKYRPLQVDAQDELGQTPLQSAVTSLLPNVVGVLLDNGADLSGFVFSKSEFFGEEFKVDQREVRWILASGVLAVAESLENAGYKLSLTEACKIMKLFTKHGLFEKTSANFERSWYNDVRFASRARYIIIIPDLPLCDLIRLQHDEAALLLTPMDYFKLARSKKLLSLPEGSIEPCILHLCEKMSRGFFKRWRMEFYLIDIFNSSWMDLFTLIFLLFFIIIYYIWFKNDEIIKIK
uniref:Uncharacterized protein n=1 Tax=Trichogramma kaykai TaxID=54128 RepID=A0ABD2WGM2_9HYME